MFRSCIRRFVKRPYTIRRNTTNGNKPETDLAPIICKYFVQYPAILGIGVGSIYGVRSGYEKGRKEELTLNVLYTAYGGALYATAGLLLGVMWPLTLWVGFMREFDVVFVKAK